jgi:hypothetical protein
MKQAALPCDSITPFGRPVEPEVYKVYARRDGSADALAPNWQGSGDQAGQALVSTALVHRLHL